MAYPQAKMIPKCLENSRSMLFVQLTQKHYIEYQATLVYGLYGSKEAQVVSSLQLR